MLSSYTSIPKENGFKKKKLIWRNIIYKTKMKRAFFEQFSLSNYNVANSPTRQYSLNDHAFVIVFYETRNLRVL